MLGHPHSPDQPPPTLEYIRAMLAQLRTLADLEKCHMLTYLIDMAYEEAGDSIQARASGAEDKRDSAA
jgi:hypothetical protein